MVTHSRVLLPREFHGGRSLVGVHGVAKSLTRLSDFTFTSPTLQADPLPVEPPGKPYICIYTWHLLGIYVSYLIYCK